MIRGLIAGTVALAATEAVLSTDAAAARTGGILAGVASVVEHFLDPTVPAIPDLNDQPDPSIYDQGASTSSGTGHQPLHRPPRHAPVRTVTA